jgi:hypothetical protein
MEGKKHIMQCCICGRVKTEQGWQYQYHDRREQSSSSHGFCTACYETEVRKIKMQMTLPPVPVYR